MRLEKTVPLRRRRPFRDPKPRILIVCEGTVTEPGYFTDLRNRERSLVELVIEAGGTPKTLVERAAALKKESKRQAKKDPNLGYEHVWCVFDVDEHPYLAEALQQARDNKIDVAISNPCFELWALLHFQDQHAWIDRSNVQHLCRQHMPGYVKRLSCDVLHPRLDDARQRAIGLNTGENPSTTVYRLVECIVNR
jgi:hypothetical protein